MSEEHCFKAQKGYASLKAVTMLFWQITDTDWNFFIRAPKAENPFIYDRICRFVLFVNWQYRHILSYLTDCVSNKRSSVVLFQTRLSFNITDSRNSLIYWVHSHYDLLAANTEIFLHIEYTPFYACRTELSVSDLFIWKLLNLLTHGNVLLHPGCRKYFKQ